MPGNANARLCQPGAAIGGDGKSRDAANNRQVAGPNQGDLTPSNGSVEAATVCRTSPIERDGREPRPRWPVLPTRPTKTKGNSHAKQWRTGRPSVELHALPPSELRALVRLCIEQHVDRDQFAHIRTVEAEEREQLRIFGQQVAAGSSS